jgi:hypothetical protein
LFCREFARCNATTRRNAREKSFEIPARLLDDSNAARRPHAFAVITFAMRGFQPDPAIEEQA